MRLPKIFRKQRPDVTPVEERKQAMTRAQRLLLEVLLYEYETQAYVHPRPEPQ